MAVLLFAIGSFYPPSLIYLQIYAFNNPIKSYFHIIFHQISDELSSLVVAQLLFLQSESSKKPVHMYINSPGGSVTAGLGIYDTMQYILPPVATWCVGQACSMASLLLAAGAPGMRHSLPNARIMIHQPSGGVQGQATDIQIQAEEIIKLKKQINGLYVKHTGLSLERIGKLIYFSYVTLSNNVCAWLYVVLM